MSRGHGRVQRAIEAVFATEPDNAFLLSELCERVYPGLNRIEKKHRIAVARAASGIPGLAHMHRETLGGELVFYRPASVMAYAMARLKSDRFGPGAAYRNNDDRPVKQTVWHGVDITSWRQYDIPSDQIFREMLAPGGSHHKYIVEGGAWWRFAAAEHARLSGDIATYERLKQEQKAEWDEFTEGMRAAFAGMPQPDRRPQPRPIVGYRLCIAKEDGTVEQQEFSSRRMANEVARGLDQGRDLLRPDRAHLRGTIGPMASRPKGSRTVPSHTSGAAMGQIPARAAQQICPVYSITTPVEST
jgi:hypothetical protein